MADCDCVFLVRLVGGFQDAAYLYMVLEAAMGGEFFLYMQVCVHLKQPCQTTPTWRHVSSIRVIGIVSNTCHCLSICSAHAFILT